MHSNNGTPPRYSESDKRRFVSTKRSKAPRLGQTSSVTHAKMPRTTAAVARAPTRSASTPLTAAALATVPTMSAMSATSAFCYAARPDQMDPVPTVEPGETTKTSGVLRPSQELFSRGDAKQTMDCPPESPPRRERSRSENTEKHVKKVEENTYAGGKFDDERSGATETTTTFVTEGFFFQQFESVNADQILPDVDVKCQVNAIIKVLKNSSTVWTVQLANLRQLRSLMKAADEQECCETLPSLADALETSARSLRSQVVREACITIGYLSTLFGAKFGYLAEQLLPKLVASLHKSVKVVSQSCNICIRIIIKNTHFVNLIPLVASHVTSKSKFIRRGSMEILCLMLCMWPQDMLGKQTAVLQSAINLGINDADNDTRVQSRRTFNVFESRFPDCANSLFKCLNVTKQKAVRPSVSPDTQSSLVNSAGDSPTGGSTSSNLGNAGTVTLTKPTVLSTTHTTSSPEVSGTEYVEDRSSSPPKRHQTVPSSSSTSRSDGHTYNDDLLRTLDILQKSVLGSATGASAQQSVHARTKQSGNVIPAKTSGKRQRDNDTENVLSSLAEIEQMVLKDAAKPGRTLQRYEETTTTTTVFQASSGIASKKDNKLVPCGVDPDNKMSDIVKTSDDGVMEDVPLETPVTKFKSKLMAKDVPCNSNIRSPKGLSNLVKTEKCCDTASINKQSSSLTSAAIEPSGGDSINPPPKKSKTKELSSKLPSFRVITKTHSSGTSSKPVYQVDEKPKPAQRTIIKPTKVVGPKNRSAESHIAKDGLQPEQVSSTESIEVTEADKVPHTRKRWSHSVPDQYKSMATNRKRFNSTTCSRINEVIVTKVNFFDAFEKVPPITVTSFADHHKRMLYIQRILANRRSMPGVLIESLKQVRALAIAYDPADERFARSIRRLAPAIQNCLNNTSTCSVVKETCITIAFLAVRLGHNFESFALTIIPTIVALLPNDAKVSAMAADLCISIILENLQSAKLIPVITGYCSSNVKIIRRECATYLRNILRDWPMSIVAKFSTTVIPMTVKQCLYDTDLRTRNIAKDVFCEFARNFPIMANGLMNELYTSRRQLLTNALSTNVQHINLAQNEPTKEKEKYATMQQEPEANDAEFVQTTDRSRLDKFIENKTRNSCDSLRRSPKAKVLVTSPALQHRAPKVVPTSTLLTRGTAEEEEHRPLATSGYHRNVLPKKRTPHGRMLGKSASPVCIPCHERFPSMIPARQKIARELVCESPVWAQEPVPEAAQSSSRRRAISSDQTSRSHALTEILADKKGESAKQNLLSSAHLMHRSSSKPQNSSKYAPKSAQPRARSASVNTPKEGQRKDLPNQRSRTPTKQRQETSNSTTRTGSIAESAEELPSFKRCFLRQTSCTASCTNAGLSSSAAHQRSAPSKSYASLSSSSDRGSVSASVASTRQHKCCRVSMKPSGKVCKNSSRKLPPSPRKSTSSVSAELCQRSVGKSAVGTRKYVTRPNDSKPGTTWQWPCRHDVPEPLLSNTSENMQSSSCVSFGDIVPSSRTSSPWKDRFNSRLPRRLNKERSRASSARVTIKAPVTTVNTLTTTSSGDLGAVAHLLSPALLSNLASLVPAKCVSTNAPVGRPAADRENDSGSSRRTVVEVEEQRSHSSQDDDSRGRRSVPAKAEDRFSFASKVSARSASLPPASDSNSVRSQASSELSQDLNQRSPRSCASPSRKARETASEEEGGDARVSDDSLESHSSNNLVESARCSDVDNLQNTDDLYRNIQLALAKRTFTPKSSSFENASSTPRVSRLDHQSLRRVSSARVNSLQPNSPCGRRNGSARSTPYCHTEEDTNRTEEGECSRPTSATSSQQRSQVSDRRDRKSRANCHVQPRAVTSNQKDRRIAETTQNEHVDCQNKQGQVNIRTSEREGLPQTKQKVRRSSSNDIMEHTSIVYTGQRHDNDHKSGQSSNTNLNLEEPGPGHIQRKLTTPSSVHGDQICHGKEHKTNSSSTPQKFRSRSVSARKLRSVCSSDRPENTAPESCQRQSPTYAEAAGSSKDECLLTPRRRSTQRHKSCDRDTTCSTSHIKSVGRHGASASASESKCSKKSLTVAFERKPLRLSSGSVQQKGLTVLKPERPISAVSQHSSTRSQRREDVSLPDHGNLSADKEGSDIDVPLQVAPLECFSRCDSIPASCQHGAFEMETANSLVHNRTDHPREDAIQPSRRAWLDGNELAHGDQTKLEESYGKYSQNITVRHVERHEHPSGDPPLRYRDESDVNEQDEPLTMMQMIKRKVEPQTDTPQRHRRHSAQQMDTLSKHSRNLSPMKEEYVTHKPARNRHDHHAECSGKTSGEEEEKARVNDETHRHHHRMEAREHVTIKIPGITLHSRNIDVTRSSDHAKSTKGVISNAPQNIRKEENANMKKLKESAMPDEVFEIDKAKTTKEVISHASQNVRKEKILKDCPMSDEVFEIDTPGHFHHYNFKTRLGDIKLGHTQMGSIETNDVDDDSDVMVNENGAKIEREWWERRWVKGEKTRAEILALMEKSLLSYVPTDRFKDKRLMLFPNRPRRHVIGDNVAVSDGDEDGDSDTSGVVSDVTSCTSQELMATAGSTWSNANSMRQLRLTKSRREHAITSPSMIGYKQRPMIRKTVADALRRIQKSTWRVRKKGLVSLKNLLNSGSHRLLNSLELKRVIRVLMKKIFQETDNAEVFVLFMEVLCDLIHVYNAQLHGWLEIILSNILCTAGLTTLQSTTFKESIQKTLDTVRVCFPCRLQLLALSNFMIRDTEQHAKDVRLVTLNYIHSLTLTLGPRDLVEMADLGLLIALLLMWISDKCNDELVHASGAILTSLYSLNPSIFQKTVLKLPRAFQETLLTMIDEDIKSMNM